MWPTPPHSESDHGACTECGEPFPCPSSLLIYEAVQYEIDRPKYPKRRVRIPRSTDSKSCPWCGTGRGKIGGIYFEDTGPDGHLLCAKCRGCLADNPYEAGTVAASSWARLHSSPKQPKMVKIGH